MIKLIKKYPYDNSYDYVKLHKSKNEQIAYFDNFDKIIVTEEDYGYIKEGESFIVNYNYDYLVNENVNYLIYNNGYKNMYCFIIHKEYVDEENTRLIYQVDVLNTFCFDFKLKNSFVERKKCTMSEVADFDEGLELGEHEIVENNLCFNKDYTFFAMWKGFINQIPTFNENGSIANVVTMPYGSVKPFCYIDDVQYPVFFSPLLEEGAYKKYTMKEIETIAPGEIVGTGILPTITNSLGAFMIPTTGTVTAGYPNYPSGGKHTGVDIANAKGTPVYADKAGTVEVINKGSTSYGLYVKITHYDETVTILAHLSAVTVKSGDTVVQGQQVGKMGSTGNSTGNHLHWEIRSSYGNHVHPYPDVKVGQTIKKKEDN